MEKFGVASGVMEPDFKSGSLDPKVSSLMLLQWSANHIPWHT